MTAQRRRVQLLALPAEEFAVAGRHGAVDAIINPPRGNLAGLHSSAVQHKERTVPPGRTECVHEPLRRNGPHRRRHRRSRIGCHDARVLQEQRPAELHRFARAASRFCRMR